MRLLFVIGFLTCVSAQARAEVVFDKPPSPPDFYDTYASSNLNAAGDYALVVDDFTLAKDSTVNGISWRGMYLKTDPTTGAYENAAPNSTGWFFGIYVDGGSSSFPFSLIGYTSVGADAVTETLAGTAPFGNTTVDYYNESVTFDGEFTLGANFKYYLAIYSFNAGDGTFFSWNSSNVGDGTSSDYYSVTNATTTVGLDRTFSLSNSAVPEPSSLALAGLGALGIVGQLRRRARA